MLTVYSGRSAADCTGYSRRDFLRVGALGLGGLTLSHLLAAKAAAGAAGSGFVRDKAVVMLFLSGGASQIETFDPKMTAPAEIRGVHGEVATPIAGVTFGGTFPLLAERATRMAVVRSFAHKVGDHEAAIVHMLTGGTDPEGRGKIGYSLGSAFARLRGANHPRTGLPTYALLTQDEVDGQYRTERGRVTKGSHPGHLGSPYAPFEPDGGGPAVKNMQLRLAERRLADRRSLLKSLDRLKRDADGSGAMEGLDRIEQQAFDLVLGGASKAFDLKDEDKRLVERYDTSKFQVGKRAFRSSMLGHQLLMARRLCERGCGFVTVHSAGWDMHADGNNPGISAGMEMLGRPLDKAVSAFLDDLEARGLADKVLLIITGDFGRTPKINKNGGRDHWSNLGPLAFAGGGLKLGQVIGQSGRHADVPASDPVGPSHLLGTVMHTLFDPAALRLESGVPRELAKLVEETRPIEQLF